jgi:hypothetical protein
LGERTQFRISGTREISEQPKHFIGAVLHRFVDCGFIDFTDFRGDLFEVVVTREVAT